MIGFLAEYQVGRIQLLLIGQETMYMEDGKLVRPAGLAFFPYGCTVYAVICQRLFY